MCPSPSLMVRFKAFLLATAMGAMLASGVFAAPGFAQDEAVARPMADAPYWDAALPVEQRVADLLARMTLEEKVAQIVTIWDGKKKVQAADFTFDPVKASAAFPNEIGRAHV